MASVVACALALGAVGCGKLLGIQDYNKGDGGPGDDASGDSQKDGSLIDAAPFGSTELYFKQSNTGASDSFGRTVALSADGSTLAVGAYLEDSNAVGIDGNQADDTAPSSGAVYVFVRSGATWAQQAYIKASNTGASDEFGFSVSLADDGSTLAVGAFAEDSISVGVNGIQADETAPTAGAAYVFARSGVTWSQQAYVKASNTGSGDEFGYAVAISGDGNTLAVGAIGEDSSAVGVGGLQTDDLTNGSTSGSVYVFLRTNTTWAQQSYVKASNTGLSDEFGNTLALSSSGSTLAVGTYLEDSIATGINGNQADNTGTTSGAVYVFQRSGANWAQQAYVKATNTEIADEFGYCLALAGDGNTLAVGAIGEDGATTGVGGNQADNAAVTSGAAYVYSRSGTIWTPQAYIKASNTEASDQFGTAIALSSDGSLLAVGATGEDSNGNGVASNQLDNTATSAGAAYLFQRSGTTWAQTMYVKATNSDPSDTFGTSVAIQPGVLAVGASGEDSAAVGIGGDQTDNAATSSGAVYVVE